MHANQISDALDSPGIFVQVEITIDVKGGDIQVGLTGKTWPFFLPICCHVLCQFQAADSSLLAWEDFGFGILVDSVGSRA